MCDNPIYEDIIFNLKKDAKEIYKENNNKYKYRVKCAFCFKEMNNQSITNHKKICKKKIHFLFTDFSFSFLN